MRAAIYVRVSTKEQSLELQKEQLLQYVSARGWEPLLYEEKITGTSADRPELKRLIKDAQERKFDLVLCWKLDRFFRSLKDLVNTLQTLEELGVSFVSLKDNIDLTTSSGRLLVHLLGAFAEFEASLIKERVCAGLERAKKRGRRLGRPPRIDSAKVLELRKRGFSLSQIAKQVGVSKSGVSKTLSRLECT